MTQPRKKLLVVIPLCITIIIVIFISMNRNDREAEIDSPFSQVSDDETNTEDRLDKPADTPANTMAIVDIKGAVKHPGIYEIGLSERVNDVLELAGGLTEKADVLAINRAEKVYDEMVIVVPREGDKTSLHAIPHNSTDQIRINQATQQEIETLSGIGPSKAEAIIQYREENGPFQKMEELLEISGIGEKTLENMKDDILVP